MKRELLQNYSKTSSEARGLSTKYNVSIYFNIVLMNDWPDCSRPKVFQWKFRSKIGVSNPQIFTPSFRTIILPVVLYGCETWSLTLREEGKLRVFENMVLRRIFGPRRDEVTEEWRRLHNEELNDLYSSPNIVRVIKSRRMRWAGHVARMGKERGVYRVLVGKPEGKRPLGRPRRRWVDNIRMDLQEVGCEYMDWIGLAQNRDKWRTFVSAVMNLRVL